MNPLVATILYWSAAAVLYAVIGYQIGKLALEVYENWDSHYTDTIVTAAAMRIILFPISSWNQVEGSWMQWFQVAGAKKMHIEGRYLFTSTLLWPVRIAWSMTMIFVLFFAIPVAALVVMLLLRIARDTFFAVYGLFKSDPQSATTQAKQ